MSVFGTNNLMDVFVAKEVAPATYSNVTSDLQSTLAQGQIAVVGFYAPGGYEEKLGAHTVNAANYPYIRFVKEVASGELLYGSKIYGKDLFSVSSVAGVAPIEQIYYLGYNGTSGSLDVSQANEFVLTIAYDHDDMMWSEQKLRNAYDYYSPAPTQQGLAMSMASQINYKEQLGALNGTGKMVIADMLAQGTATALDSTATLAVTNGSTTITASAAQTTNWAIGTVIRIGTGATNTTDPVYVITSVASTTVATINMPYQGATNAAVATANVRTLSGITNWGIRVTGQPLTWRKDFFKFNKVKFHFDIKGFGATQYDRPGSLTQTTISPGIQSKESSKGKGFWQEVSEYESFSAGFQGALNRMVVPLPTGLIETPTTTPAFSGAGTGLGANYNMWYIESKDTQNNSPIVSTPAMRIQTFVFFPDGTQGDAQQADLVNNANWNVDAWFAAYGFTLATV